MYYEAFNGSHIAKPEYQKYLALIQETIYPLINLDEYEALSREDKLKLLTDYGKKFVGEASSKDYLPDIKTTIGYKLLKDPYALSDKWLAEDRLVQKSRAKKETDKELGKLKEAGAVKQHRYKNELTGEYIEIDIDPEAYR